MLALAGSETSSALVVKAISNIFALRTDIVNIGGGVDDLQASLITLFGGIQSDLAVGEEPREFIFDNIRVTTWVDGQDEFAGEKYYVPRTSYETLEGAPDERVQWT